MGFATLLFDSECIEWFGIGLCLAISASAFSALLGWQMLVILLLISP